MSLSLDIELLLVSESLLLFMLDMCAEANDAKHELHDCPLESGELFPTKLWCIGVDVWRTETFFKASVV